MAEQSLINVCAVVGIGLFTGSFGLLQIFREPIKKYQDNLEEQILDSDFLFFCWPQ